MCLNDAVAFPDGSAETPELFSLLHIDVVEITSRICFNSFFDNSALCHAMFAAAMNEQCFRVFSLPLLNVAFNNGVHFAVRITFTENDCFMEQTGHNVRVS